MEFETGNGCVCVFIHLFFKFDEIVIVKSFCHFIFAYTDSIQVKKRNFVKKGLL